LVNSFEAIKPIYQFSTESCELASRLYISVAFNLSNSVGENGVCWTIFHIFWHCSM